ncbi:MAG TPA: hypothetical protein DEB40_04135 [Elusimicrobia bacterium]|nr:hypothetical protein [Elusimicrobiota bacterium]HBT60914.1 hypothetical protein [Elusimicrobiota bacterium]
MGLCASGARAQPLAPVASASTATAVNLSAYLGNNLPRGRGPWVLGEVLFFSSNRLVSEYTWREAVRGNRGALYSNADIESDIERLMGLKKFDKVEAELYEIPGTPVPREFEGVAASTSQVRLVFSVVEKVVSETTTKPKAQAPPAALSGVVLTPTAYRGAGRYTTPGMGLDINAAYFIGRLYGKNDFANAPRKVNYIDRLGVWLLTADGKMQIQSETWLRPAISAGGQAAALLRDSPQPQLQDPNTTLTVKASDKSTKILTDGYIVASKKFGPARTSLGLMQGTMGDLVASLSEFLTPEALRFYAGKPNQRVTSRTVPFASVLFLPRPEYPLAVEVMKFNGSPLNPWLVNFKIGYFLKLNFDVAFLKYQGGYDVLGVLQFRYNHFPQR